MTEAARREWVEAHAIAFALGELDDDDTRRFQASIVDDPDYEDLDALRDPEVVGHVPAALIARWDAQGRNLRDPERELVEQHLRACEHCREDLQVVRWVSRAGPGGRVIRPSRWRPWVGGALIGAAAALAFLFPSLLRPPDLTTGQHLEVLSPRAVRGPDAPVYRLGADATAFLLAVALPVDLEPGSRLVLTAPDGSILVDSPVDPAPSAQLLVLADPSFPAGEYTVRVRGDGEGGHRDLGRFMIEHPE